MTAELLTSGGRVLSVYCLFLAVLAAAGVQVVLQRLPSTWMAALCIALPFAVATEQFFDQPRQLVQQAPELYRVLKAYYRQDPLSRLDRNTCAGESGHVGSDGPEHK